MKKAFTLLELVFVIVVVGILAVVIIPRMKSDSLQQAAIQVVSDIRYTQHLAMLDDKYDSSDVNWYKKRWQIFFANTEGSDNKWAYTIFSDYLGSSAGNPDAAEIATNPLDISKKLTGGYSAGTVAYNDSRATKKLNLGNSYGVTNVTFSDTCTVYGNKRIAFDYLGRPMYGGSHLLDSAYADNSKSRLLSSNCDINLSNGTKSISIRIRPETGYACILNNTGTACQ